MLFCVNSQFPLIIAVPLWFLSICCSCALQQIPKVCITFRFLLGKNAYFKHRRQRAAIESLWLRLRVAITTSLSRVKRVTKNDRKQWSVHYGSTWKFPLEGVRVIPVVEVRTEPESRSNKCNVIDNRWLHEHRGFRRPRRTVEFRLTPTFSDTSSILGI